jgi:hypothetical protein
LKTAFDTAARVAAFNRPYSAIGDTRPIQCPEFPVFIGWISEIRFATPLLLRFMHIGKSIFSVKDR